MKKICIVTLIATIFLSCKNQYTQEIEKTCSNCSTQKIPKSNFILVTKPDGTSNIFDKEDMKFRLSNWYPARFNSGILFDDITFTLNGTEIMCGEDSYNLLSDKYLEEKQGNRADNYSSQSSEPSTVASCVVCGKRCDFAHENIYMGHHLVIDGQMSSDVVCGIDCDMILRKRNEETINKETEDPNSERDPDIKYPDLHEIEQSK